MADPAYIALTPEQLWWLAKIVGGGHGDTRTAAAVAGAESSGRPWAFNVNTDTHRSVDRGLWQLNSFWHAEVSDECAYRALCNARNAYRISNGWREFTQWSTFNAGLHLNHYPPVSALPVPINQPYLSFRWRPSGAPPSGLGSPSQPPFGPVGIIVPAEPDRQDYSGKVRRTGQRAGAHGSRVNDAVNAIHRIGVGRSRY